MIARIVLCLAALSAAAVSQDKKDFELTPASAWVDTGIDFKPGDTLKVTAAGSVQYIGAKPCGPEGLPRGWMDLIRQLPLNEAGRGALIGRITASPAARAFLIGPQTSRTVPVAGRLYLAVNQTPNDNAQGSFKVTVEYVATAVQPASLDNVKLPVFTQEMLDRIPVRVQDAEGNAGDRVNFIVIGSENRVTSALSAAGWVTVDRTKKDAVIRGLLGSLSKQAYVTLPMSELEMFGRPQDYGYAQGDPVRVIASRHHFRLWKAPFTAGAETVWVGAGTHDIGFDRDQRNGSITHKIDPDTDGEREYIGQSLQQTGMVVKTEYLRAKNAVEKAKTAHGEEFHSDGRTLIIYLRPDTSAEVGTKFADLFCSVLKQKNPDEGDWGACDQYIDGGGKDDVKLGDISTQYRVLIVPGFMSSCFSDSPAFLEGQEALRDRYKLTVDLLPVPNDSSDDNAKVVGNYIREQAKTDQRKFIVVGYSKGGPDVQVALAKEDGMAQHVAAFVSVAGAIGGSPIADVLPAQADKWIRQYSLKGCQGDTAAGFKSLQRAVRRAFLASYPHPPVPSYSVVAKSDKTSTSKALLQTWQLLTSYSPIQDGQLLRDDAVVPDSKFLGIALADHFAVALPFDKSSDSAIRSGMDKTKYPRAALLEAIVRFVTADLGDSNAASGSR
jgi:hypothetical protein